MGMQENPFSFVIEPPSPLRIQMWAWFAGRVSTQDACNVVEDAFCGFWWGYWVAEHFRQATEMWRFGFPHQAVRWLDYMLASLRNELGRWGNVVRALENDQEQFGSWGQCLNDARAYVGCLSGLIEQAVAQIVALCEQGGYELPEKTQELSTVFKNVFKRIQKANFEYEKAA